MIQTNSVHNIGKIASGGAEYLENSTQINRTLSKLTSHVLKISFLQQNQVHVLRIEVEFMVSSRKRVGDNHSESSDFNPYGDSNLTVFAFPSD
jgi:hypothetical protein